MQQDSLTEITADQAERAFWEVGNVIDCIPDALWDKAYCGMPLWKHVYHMLHSLDRWYLNPAVYEEPAFHQDGLNDLDTVSVASLSREQLERYFRGIKEKIRQYHKELTDGALLVCPPNTKYTKFTLIMAQFRHLHSHMGMLMGILIAETGKWPRVLGMENEIPEGTYQKFFD